MNAIASSEALKLLKLELASCSSQEIEARIKTWE